MSVSQARGNFPKVVQSSKKGDSVILLKNGEPLVVVIDYQEYENYQKYKEQKKEETLEDLFTNIQEEFSQNSTGKKWLATQGKKESDLSDEDLFDLISEECKKQR